MEILSQPVLELSRLLVENIPEISSKVLNSILDFYIWALKENKIQNLTRLVSPRAFFEGHVRDVLALRETQWIHGISLDLGSGLGVPGLLFALFDLCERKQEYLKKQDNGGRWSWILTDSEQSKARYLKETVDYFDLKESVLVFSGRAEAYLSTHFVDNVVVRAVGSIKKMYSWIRGCSTWNNFILFKGPSWEQEWSEFQKTPWRNELQIVESISYSVKNVSSHETVLLERKLVRIARM